MTKNTDSPFQLKNIYTPQLINEFGGVVLEVYNDFPLDTFSKKVFNTKWRSLELKQRMRHISDQLRDHLPADYKKALPVLTKVTDKLIKRHGEKMMFEYGFIPDFIERFGIEYPDISIPALAKVTRWTSAEFAVRPYIKLYPERMYQQMLEWSSDKSFAVRRLSSEGIRPRLPWGMGIPVLKKDPSPILPILENLKSDPAETVRRSVANNLNDISKDHPELFLDIIHKWQGQSVETDWIIRHASRGLLRKGHPVALSVFGFSKDQKHLVVEDFVHSNKVMLGDKLDFSFTIINKSTKPVNARVEFAVQFVLSTGKTSKKVFHIKESGIAGRASFSIKKYLRFVDLTTRKHYPGKHTLSILINGREMVSGDFTVK